MENSFYGNFFFPMLKLTWGRKIFLEILLNNIALGEAPGGNPFFSLFEKGKFHKQKCFKTTKLQTLIRASCKWYGGWLESGV